MSFASLDVCTTSVLHQPTKNDESGTGQGQSYCLIEASGESLASFATKYWITEAKLLKKKVMPSLIPSEHEEQVTFVEWLETKGYKFSAIPNGWFGNIGLIKKMQKEGVRAGVPDMFIIVKDHLVWIEMKKKDLKPKRGGKGGVSDEQWRWIDALNRCDNCQAYVCYGADEAIKVIESI